MYFCVVAREIVDSCRPSSPAMSFRISGRMAAGPWLKSRLAFDDGLGHAQDGVEALLDVADHPLGLLQLGLQASVADSFWLPSICAYRPLICRRGTAALLSVTCQPRRVLRTITSGTA